MVDRLALRRCRNGQPSARRRSVGGQEPTGGDLAADAGGSRPSMAVLGDDTECVCVFECVCVCVCVPVCVCLCV